jgi:hypothetical protein
MITDLFSGRMLRTYSVLIIISGFYLISCSVFSQNFNITNPFLQQKAHIQKKGPLVGSQITSSVITINNWDNFNLGIDFATTCIAANPTVPAWYFTAFSTNEGHQTDNGIDWESEVPDFGGTMKGDPVVAYDSLGNLFYGNMFGTNIVLGLKVIKSTDNGATWSPAVTALNGTDKCWMACDQTHGPNANNIYTCMTDNVKGNFSRSIDHGQTFTSTFAPNTQSIPGMMVCVGPLNNIQGGSVYVVTNSGTQFASIFTFYRSINGGLTFAKMSDAQYSNYVGTAVAGRNSVSGMRTHAYPLIAADNSYGPHRGRLYLVYASNDPPGNGNMPDIFCRFSDNGGTTWSLAIRVNDDDSTQNNSQWHPAIWCDKDNGRLYIQWMDTRDTPTHDSAYIYATYSDDGGLTFAPNQKISNQKMVVDCITCNGGGNPSYEGDYNGIYSNKKVAMLSWTDFRYGNFMSTTGYFPDFAMAIDHTIDTLYTWLDSTTFKILIPEVKLFTDTVLLSDTVIPAPDSGAIIVSFPSGNIITSYPDSLPAKIVLNGAVPPGYYQIKFIAESPNGTPVHQRTATIFVRSGDSVYVVASATPDSICAGESSQLFARTIKGKSPISFSWTPTTGLNDPNIADPIASPVVNTLYHVRVVDSVSHSAADSTYIRIKPAPDSPGPIHGPIDICHDSITTYSIQAVPGANVYSWTVPVGAEILNGQNTPYITIQWGDSSGIVSVIAGNNCGISNPSVSEVIVTNSPIQPTVIHGPGQVCNGETASFSIDQIPDATTYTWAVPEDAMIISGQNTNSIDVLWGSSSGNISTVAVNNCGISQPLYRFINLETLPGSAGLITGNDSVCSDYETYNYTVPIITEASFYSWAVPRGTSIISGSTSNSIIISVSPGAESGQLSVEGENDCGSGPGSVKYITVKVCTGIFEIQEEAKISVYPNPAGEELNIAISEGEESMDIRIIDIRGQSIFREALNNIGNGFRQKINVSTFSRGVFFLELSGNKTFIIRKIILQ